MGQLIEFVGHHPYLIGALLVSLAAVLFYELRLRAGGVTHVSAADAVRLINKGALVIDVRKPTEFEAGHIVNARNIELDRLQQENDAIAKKKDKILLAVCENGGLSGKAARRVAQSRLRELVQLAWRHPRLACRQLAAREMTMADADRIVVYSTPFCGYCGAAKRLLAGKGVDVTEIDVMFDPEQRQKMMEKSGGRRTVPQIFIDGRHIGGFEDLSALDANGELDRLLATKPSTQP